MINNKTRNKEILSRNLTKNEELERLGKKNIIFDEIKEENIVIPQIRRRGKNKEINKNISIQKRKSRKNRFNSLNVRNTECLEINKVNFSIKRNVSKLDNHKNNSNFNLHNIPSNLLVTHDQNSNYTALFIKKKNE